MLPSSRTLLGVASAVSFVSLIACDPSVASEPDGDTSTSAAGTSSQGTTTSEGPSTSSPTPQTSTSSTEPAGTSSSTSDPVDGSSSSSSGAPVVRDGCSRIDFLFVIDNSGSMGDHQENLTANFPVFINAIEMQIDNALDVHVMVADTDPEALDCTEACEPPEECLFNGFCSPAGNPLCQPHCIAAFQCEDQPGGCEDPLPADPCDVMGAGITFPRGQNASNTDCGFSSGGRYIDETEPDLDSAFTCAATVGTGAIGPVEQPLGSMLQAVTPGTEANTCNAGFLRDDAILVVTFITDEDDDEGDGSQGTVEGWRQALIAAKNGNEESVVVLGLFGDRDCAEPSPRLSEFVESWGERGLRGSVCEPSYAEFFEQAAGIVDTTCENFEPAGG